MSANTRRHRQRSSSARPTPGQRNLSIWQLGGGSLYLRSGSGQHQRQPRQHLCSSMRSPSASHLRVVSMSVQHQARSVCDWPYMGGIGNNGGNRHRRHITSTSAASAFQPQHQRSCSSAATHGAVCWRQQSNIIYACTIIFFSSPVIQQSGENFIPAVIDPSQQFDTAAALSLVGLLQHGQPNKRRR